MSSNLKRFSDIELEKDHLTREATIKAADMVRAFEDSPAWFRLQQFVYTERQRLNKILEDPPSRHCMSDYAETSGQLRGLNRFEQYLNFIIQEGIAANDSNRNAD